MGKVNTDLKGLATLQQNYLNSLSDKTNDPDLIDKVTTLQNQLSDAHQDFKEADITSSTVLTHQDAVKDIVDTEKERLLEKKQNIDNALSGKQREIALNDSYQQKQAEYNKLKLAWVIALAISILSTILKNNFEFIPSFIFNTITIIALFIASMYSINIYIEISRREKINFNKLDLPEPAARTQRELEDAAKAAAREEGGDLLGGVNVYGCVGSYCCNEGTKWNSEISKCVHDEEYEMNKIQDEPESDTFTTMIKNPSFIKRRININNVKENSANEYDNYSKVK
tara:strand:- start:4384 stop:5235 length:852 start_codon:yes stop_codon:yes gene_type:complete